jgi:hypothetical protein
VKSALIAALLAAAPAEQAQRPCLTEAQVEDLTLFALPPLLEAAATACAPALPADAYLLNGGRALAKTVGAESTRRWAGASTVLATMAKDKFPAGLSEATARGLLHDLAAQGLAAKGAQKECGRINRLANLLSPLPPKNMAGLIVLGLDIAGRERVDAKDKKADGPPLLCSAIRS